MGWLLFEVVEITNWGARKTDLGGSDYYLRNSGLPPSFRLPWNYPNKWTFPLSATEKFQSICYELMGILKNWHGTEFLNVSKSEKKKNLLGTLYYYLFLKNSSRTNFLVLKFSIQLYMKPEFNSFLIDWSLPKILSQSPQGDQKWWMLEKCLKWRNWIGI